MKRKKLPYLENEIWHKIFAATDLETCRANRIAFHDMLSRDWDAAWKFLIADSEKDEPRPLKSPRDWPMMILLLRERKIPEALRDNICEKMAIYKSSSLLREARQADCPWSGDVLGNAVCYGSLECLRWARENGCEKILPDSIYTFTAASYGFLDVLKYLHQHNFFWNEDTMYHALNGGHLDCLKFAHQNGCPSNSVLVDAERYHTEFWSNDHSDCVQYLRDAGCPQVKESISTVVRAFFPSIDMYGLKVLSQRYHTILNGNPSWSINWPLIPLTVASTPSL